MLQLGRIAGLTPSVLPRPSSDPVRLLSLMGRIDENNRPDAALSAMGFRRSPGRVVTEIVGTPPSTHSGH